MCSDHGIGNRYKFESDKQYDAISARKSLKQIQPTLEYLHIAAPMHSAWNYERCETIYRDLGLDSLHARVSVPPSLKDIWLVV